MIFCVDLMVVLLFREEKGNGIEQFEVFESEWELSESLLILEYGLNQREILHLLFVNLKLLYNWKCFTED